MKLKNLKIYNFTFLICIIFLIFFTPRNANACDNIIFSKRKVGFNIPIDNYFDFNNIKLREEILSPSPIFEILDQSKIRNLLTSGKISNSYSKFIFNFINARIFCEEFSL